MQKTIPYDVDKIREDFPILKRVINGKPLVYLDNAATSQKPKQVIETLDRYYREYNANIHRGIYKIREEATAAHEEARAKVARFINAQSTDEIVFLRGTTEAINLVAQSWGRANIGLGDSSMHTEMEHHSNIVPWQLLAREKTASLKYVGVSDDGVLRQDEFHQHLQGEGVKLFCVTQASNMVG